MSNILGIPRCNNHFSLTSNVFVGDIKVLAIFLISLISLKSYAQGDSINQKWFTNDSITYTIAHITPGVYTEKEASRSGYFINLQMTKKCKEKLMKKDSSFWMKKF